MSKQLFEKLTKWSTSRERRRLNEDYGPVGQLSQQDYGTIKGDILDGTGDVWLINNMNGDKIQLAKNGVPAIRPMALESWLGQVDSVPLGRGPTGMPMTQSTRYPTWFADDSSRHKQSRHNNILKIIEDFANRASKDSKADLPKGFPHDGGPTNWQKFYEAFRQGGI